jgi:hypothetical protein
MAVGLGLGHAQALTPCVSAPVGLLRKAVFWIDACSSPTTPDRPGTRTLETSTLWLDACESDTV